MGRQGHVVLRCGRPSALAGSFASMMKEALLQNLAVPDDGVSCIDLAQRVEKSGFVVVPQCLQGAMEVRLSSYLNATTYAARNLLSVPIVRELAGSAPVRVLAETVLGKNCFAVKATFFNKTQEANWKVVWHQDLTIVVRERGNFPDLARGQSRRASITSSRQRTS